MKSAPILAAIMVLAAAYVAALAVSLHHSYDLVLHQAYEAHP